MPSKMSQKILSVVVWKSAAQKKIRNHRLNKDSTRETSDTFTTVEEVFDLVANLDGEDEKSFMSFCHPLILQTPQQIQTLRISMKMS